MENDEFSLPRLVNKKKTLVGVYLEFKMKRWFLWLVEQLILPSL